MCTASRCWSGGARDGAVIRSRGRPTDVAAGVLDVETPGGAARTIEWDGVEIGNGWVYLGWIVADREAGRIALGERDGRRDVGGPGG